MTVVVHFTQLHMDVNQERILCTCLVHLEHSNKKTWQRKLFIIQKLLILN